MAITKQYLDLNGLKYVLEKLVSTSTGTGIVSEVSQKNGIVSVTKRALGTSDIPALAYLSGASLDASKTGNTTTFTSTFAKGVGESATTAFGITTTGALTSALTGNVLTLGYTPTGTGYITVDDNNNILIDSTKLATKTSTTGADDQIALKGYVDIKVNAAIAGGVQYKGTTTTKPASPANGDMYKVTSDIKETDGSIFAKEGDVIIYNGNGETAHWDVIPSGDDVEYTGIKADGTELVKPTDGGTVDFKAGEGLSISNGTNSGDKTITYAHTVPTGAGVKTSGLYKFGTDKFGHVNSTSAVATADLTALLDSTYMKIQSVVTSLGGKSGAITLKATNTTNKGSVNLAISDTGELSASIYGLGSAAYTNSSAYLPSSTTYVSTIGGKSGAITLDTAPTGNGAVVFSISPDGKISGSVQGLDNVYAAKSHTHAIGEVDGLQSALDGKQAKFADGSATITTATATATYTAYKDASTAETIRFNSVSQTNGAISKGAEENIISNITRAQIDDLFKNA